MISGAFLTSAVLTVLAVSALAATSRGPLRSYDTEGYRYVLQEADPDPGRTYDEAAAHCAQQGGELAPYDGTGESLEAMAQLCFGRPGPSLGCWVRRTAAAGGGACGVLGPGGEPLQRGCAERALAVCRFRRQDPLPYIFVGTDGHVYELFDGVRQGQASYDDAVERCGAVGGQLAPHDDAAADDSAAAFAALCGARGEACWEGPVAAAAARGMLSGAAAAAGSRLVGPLLDKRGRRCPARLPSPSTGPLSPAGSAVLRACAGRSSFVCRTPAARDAAAAAPPAASFAGSDGRCYLLRGAAGAAGDAGDVAGAAAGDAGAGAGGGAADGGPLPAAEAAAACRRLGAELSPFGGADDSRAALLALCGGRGEACWVARGGEGGGCPMVGPEGRLGGAGCQTAAAYVCSWRCGAAPGAGGAGDGYMGARR